MYQLFTDTDTDILPKEAEEYGYKLISMPYIIDGNETYPYEDFEVFEYHEFYDKLRGGVLPTTCALSPLKYTEYFEPTFREGKDILYVHLSEAMSGTFNAMRIAVDELLKKYPERKFYTVDTKAISIGSLIIVKEIGDMAKRGATPEEILEWAKTEVDKYAVYFYADDLKFFAKSGRVSGLAAFFGNIIGLRPILSMGSNGKMGAVAKAKGKKATIKKIFDYVDELQDDIKGHRVLVGHTDALPLAEEIVSVLKEKYGDDLNCEIYVVNPTAGSHCGPDTVGITFHAIHR